MARLNFTNFIRTTNKSREGSKYFEEELTRLQQLILYEEEWYRRGAVHIAGVDEAGRGPLAGPVIAAAVILPRGLLIEGINDSKKISEKKREKLYDIIIREAVDWAVGIIDNDIIDQVNILNATRMAMKLAVKKLKIKPDVVLIDSEKLTEVEIPQKSIIRGDSLSISIAAASIIAKVTRDRIITKLDEIYSGYGFAKHKGYGTQEHIQAIEQKGLCPIHRRSFTRKLFGG